MIDSFCWRNVKRVPGFDETAAEIFGSAQVADDMLAGIECAIARNPVGDSVEVPDSVPPARAIKTPGSRKWPAVVVYFVHDARFVTMIGIFQTLPTED